VIQAVKCELEKVKSAQVGRIFNLGRSKSEPLVEAGRYFV
jgi:hypothetical protein